MRRFCRIRATPAAHRFEQVFYRSPVRTEEVAMRWDSLRLIEDQPEALIERSTVVRTIDTPEFRGVTFYEIHARSIINKVPAVSRVPFTWTINPYRGCTHACNYCIGGDTPILMADGRTKPISQVRVGDEIFGTERRGTYRRYVKTMVIDHWRTMKLAYRITLANGTQVIASADHRFLSDRGWKYVTDGVHQRPHLTTNNKLMGIGVFAEPPKKDADYRRGYLCGMIRGDGTVGHYIANKPDGRKQTVHRFRLALVDHEALERSRRYLAGFGIPTTEFTFQEATSTRKRVEAIRNQTKVGVQAIEELIQWPVDPPSEWRKGFIAGIFDAEGHLGATSQGHMLRICNTDTEILDRISEYLDQFCFSSVRESADLDRAKPIFNIRLLGGLREQLRFFHTFDPAITRKMPIEGRAVKSDGRTEVLGVEPVGLEMPMYDITTGTGDFVAHGVISHNCFARKTHEYLDFDSGADFDSRIVVKVNAGELVRRELAAARWGGEPIAMGTNVDCYQRAEGRYRLMPGILGALRDARNPFSILTKGTLILRDLPLLQEAAELTEVGTAVSVGFLDQELWRLYEPGTPSPLRRLEVCATLNEGGIGCGVLMGPVLPYLTDSPRQIDAAVRQIAAAGATSVSAIPLHLRPGAREWFFRALQEHHPELVAPYRRLYGRGAYAPKEFQERIARRVREAAHKYGLDRRPARREAPARPAAPEQLPLL
jgi:DNA repair photolyase